jgi:hypothetical protein
MVQRVEDGIGRVSMELSGPLESDPEYQLIVSSNRLVQDIDEEIITVSCRPRHHTPSQKQSLVYTEKGFTDVNSRH